MKERLPHDEEDRQRPAEPPARTDHTSALVLQLQQTAGNQATARLLQRLRRRGHHPRARADERLRVARMEAARQDEPRVGDLPAHRHLVATARPAVQPREPDRRRVDPDGARADAGLLARRLVHRGSRLGNPRHHARRRRVLQPGHRWRAERRHLRPRTGPRGAVRHPWVTGFLGSYAQEFVEGYVGSGGDDMEAYHQIAHEQQATAIEERFSEWRKKKEKADAEEEAKRPTPRTPSRRRRTRCVPRRRSPRSGRSR